MTRTSADPPLARTARQVARLVERGLLTTSEGVRIEDRSRRNCSFAVVESPDRSFFVKQNAESPEMAEREAALYRRAASLPFAEHLPRLRLASRGTIVLDLIPDAQTLTELVSAGRLRNVAASDLGTALAKVHRSDGAPRARRPSILDSAAPPIEFLRHASEAERKILRIVQSSKLIRSRITALRTAWRPSALIHGDLRADNVLIRNRRGQRAGADIWFVDWEHSGMGDPAWDVAGVIASFLFLWVDSFPFDEADLDRAPLASAGVQVERIPRGISPFWSSYALGRAFTPRELRAFLLHALGLSAARLLEHAFEDSRNALRIRPAMACAIQVALNILTAPGRAADLLVGKRR